MLFLLQKFEKKDKKMRKKKNNFFFARKNFQKDECIFLRSMNTIKKSQTGQPYFARMSNF